MSAHVGELLSVYLDGELSGKEGERLGTHLAECEQCRSELDGLAVTRARLRSLPLVEVPPEALGLTLAPVIPLHRKKGVWTGVAAAAAAVIILAASVLAPSPQTSLDPTELSNTFDARTSLETGLGSGGTDLPADEPTGLDNSSPDQTQVDDGSPTDSGTNP